MRSVRFTLTAVVLVLIAMAAASVWYVGDVYNHRNTGLLAAQIQRELAARITARVRDLLATPHRLNAVGEGFIEGGQLDLSTPDRVNRVFHNALSAYPHINAIFFGGADGRMYGARWSQDAQQADVMIAGADTGGVLQYYRADGHGGRQDLVESAPDYDPRARSWYTGAAAQKQSVWSPIYVDFATGALVMTAARPVLGSGGTLRGVLGCGIQFDQIDLFMESLDVGTTGIAYLMERDGTLITTSVGDKSLRLGGTPPVRLRALESASSAVSQSASQIAEKFGSYAGIDRDETFSLLLDNRRAYGSVFPITDGFGLNWLGVVVVPEEDYMAAIQERNQMAFVVFLLVVLAALIAGMISARFLTRPLAQLAGAARGIVDEAWDAPVDIGRRDEFGELARAFERMRAELRARIGQLRDTQAALRESEEHYARAQEAARAVPWSWSLASGEIRWTEQRALVLADTAGEHRIAARDFLHHVHPDDREMVARTANEGLAGGEDYDVEYRLDISDDTRLWVSARGKVVFDERGAASGMTGVLLDISDRKRLEERLLEAQKMEAVGRLAGGIAHDFNNLLQAILGFGELARETAGPDSPIADDLNEIVVGARRASELVRQLLAFSRRQVLSLGSVALDRVVAEMGKMLARLIDETIELRLEMAREKAVIRADRGQVEQVLVNLCLNARDAMPEGGTLTIAVDSAAFSEADCEDKPWARPGRYHVLRVRDTGCGIDKKTMAVMFDPFFTTKEVGKGTGLGLAMVYGIVEQHQGLIHVESTVGAGTTVEVYFQETEAEEKGAIGAIGEPVRLPGRVAGNGATILLAEDNDAVRQLARQVLERAGYTVLAAEDGDSAIELFEQYGADIQAAFLDVVMPGKNGRAVLEHLQATSPDLPVLFASGYAEGGVHTDFVLDEGLTLIQKPYSADTLLVAMQKLMRDSHS